MKKILRVIFIAELFLVISANGMQINTHVQHGNDAAHNQKASASNQKKHTVEEINVFAFDNTDKAPHDGHVNGALVPWKVWCKKQYNSCINLVLPGGILGGVAALYMWCACYFADQCPMA